MSANSALGEKTQSLDEAMEKAKAFSIEEKQSDIIKIGITMSFGEDNSVSADDVGSAFVNELKRRGYEAKYFYYRTDRIGGALSFQIADVTLGPWNAEEAANRIKEVTDVTQGANNIQKLLNQ